MNSTNERNHMESLFPPKESRPHWGWFGYEGTMCDSAIRADNPAMIEECVRRGWINANSEMMDGKTILQECEKKAPKCAAKLREIGPLAAPAI